MVDAPGLLYLLQAAGAGFPTGAFAHSLGFETLVAEGEIRNATSLEEVAQLWLLYGLAPLDGAAVALAYAAASADDVRALATLDEHLSALKLPRESREASVKTGEAFLFAAESAFGGERTARYRYGFGEGLFAAHAATAFGVAAADARVSSDETVLAFLHAAFASLVTVVARLVPIGQVDVQRILARARQLLLEAAASTQARGLDELATGTALLDVASMRHERLYTRLCIS